MKWFRLSYRPALHWWQFRKRWLVYLWLKSVADALAAHVPPGVDWWGRTL